MMSQSQRSGICKGAFMVGATYPADQTPRAQFERKAVRAGMFMTSDGGHIEHGHRRAVSAPPRPASSSLAEIAERLESVKRQIAALRAQRKVS